MSSTITVLCDTIIKHAQGRIEDIKADCEREYEKKLRSELNWRNSHGLVRSVKVKLGMNPNYITEQQLRDEHVERAKDCSGPLFRRQLNTECGIQRFQWLIRAAAAHCGSRFMTLSVEDAAMLKLPSR
jgi:hypothetical protein